jgi:tyrosine-protein phosphatase SIW14
VDGEVDVNPIVRSDIVEIVNFAVVKPGQIYRGGQPVAPSAWRALQILGVKTVVKLDYPEEGVDDGATALGMKVIDCRMPPKDFWQAIGRPDTPDIDRALRDLDVCDKPVFAHCFHGQDRTSLIIGMWRVLYDQWTCQQAYREMLAYGFHPELIDLSAAWHDFVDIEMG